jgi:hypothetical protein
MPKQRGGFKGDPANKSRESESFGGQKKRKGDEDEDANEMLYDEVCGGGPFL